MAFRANVSQISFCHLIVIFYLDANVYQFTVISTTFCQEALNFTADLGNVSSEAFDDMASLVIYGVTFISVYKQLFSSLIHFDRRISISIKLCCEHAYRVVRCVPDRLRVMFSSKQALH
jgi:hypothetical protein